MKRLSEQAAAELEAMRLRLLEMLVPLAQKGPPPEGEEAGKEALRDALWTAAHALEKLLGEGHMPAGVDLDQGGEEIRKALHDFVLWDYFTPRTLEDTGDVSVPGYTPEESGLRVFFEYGRWFVTWLDLGEDSSQPEAIRRELFVFEKDKDGNLYLDEV